MFFSINQWIWIPKIGKRHRKCMKYAKIFVLCNNKLLLVRTNASSAEDHITFCLIFQLASLILSGLAVFVYFKYDWISQSKIIYVIMLNWIVMQFSVNFSEINIDMLDHCCHFGIHALCCGDIEDVLYLETNIMSISPCEFSFQIEFAISFLYFTFESIFQFSVTSILLVLMLIGIGVYVKEDAEIIDSFIDVLDKVYSQEKEFKVNTNLRFNLRIFPFKNWTIRNFFGRGFVIKSERLISTKNRVLMPLYRSCINTSRYLKLLEEFLPLFK